MNTNTSVSSDPNASAGSTDARSVALSPRLIRTEHVYPPIPIRSMDWSAVFADSYEPGEPIGRGATEAEAIADLLIESDYEGPVSFAKREGA